MMYAALMVAFGIFLMFASPIIGLPVIGLGVAMLVIDKGSDRAVAAEMEQIADEDQGNPTEAELRAKQVMWGLLFPLLAAGAALFLIFAGMGAGL